MSLYDDHVRGCSDGNCVWRKPQGMHTNGGCKCLYDLEWQTKHYDALTVEEKQALRREWSAVKRNIKIMRDEIESLRDGLREVVRAHDCSDTGHGPCECNACVAARGALRE